MIVYWSPFSLRLSSRACTICVDMPRWAAFAPASTTRCRSRASSGCWDSWLNSSGVMAGPELRQSIQAMGLEFPTVLGVAAGFDPLGHLGKGASALGFGFNEIGSLDAASLPDRLPLNLQGSA